MGGCEEEASVVAVAQYELLKDLKNEIADTYCRICNGNMCKADCRVWDILEISDKKSGYPYDCQWK